MPLTLALAVKETGAGHRLGALEGIGFPSLPMHPWGGGGLGTASGRVEAGPSDNMTWAQKQRRGVLGGGGGAGLRLGGLLSAAGGAYWPLANHLHPFLGPPPSAGGSAHRLVSVI